MVLHVVVQWQNDQMMGDQLSRNASSYNYSFCNQILLLLKVFISLASFTYTQNAVLLIYDPQSPSFLATEKHTWMVIWLIFLLMIFYYNVLSQIIFLVVSRFCRYYTLRDRVDLGGEKRYQVDFLDHVKDDIHWFQILCIQVLLCVFSIKKRDPLVQLSITPSFCLICAKLMIGLFTVAYIFFTTKRLNFKQVLLPLLAVSVLLTISLAYLLASEYTRQGTFWTIYMFESVVISIFIYAQLLLDFRQFGQKVRIWECDYWMRIEIKKLLGVPKARHGTHLSTALSTVPELRRFSRHPEAGSHVRPEPSRRTGRFFDEDQLRGKVEAFLGRVRNDIQGDHDEEDPATLIKSPDVARLQKDSQVENDTVLKMIAEEYDHKLFLRDHTRRENMYADFFSATFFALRHKYKKKYHLLVEDQVSYYFESLFIVSIQVILCLCIIFSGELQPHYTYEFLISLCTFFTTLVLHYSCIAIIRNGMQMCKFVVFHHEEFSNPVETFMLGIFIIIGNILCEITNAAETLSQRSVIELISKFVAFKLLIQIQDYYLRSRHNFAVKQAVQDPLIIAADTAKIFGHSSKSKQVEFDEADAETLSSRAGSRRHSLLDSRSPFDSRVASVSSSATSITQKKFFSMASRDHDEGQPVPGGPGTSIKVLYYIYKLVRFAFTSIYFYFFPLFYLTLPFSRLSFTNMVRPQ